MLLSACAGYAYADDTGEYGSDGGDFPDETGGADIGPTTDGFFSYEEFDAYYDKWRDQRQGDFLGDFFEYVSGLVGNVGNDSAGEGGGGGHEFGDETGGSSEATDNSPVDLMGMQLVGEPVESGAATHGSIRNYRNLDGTSTYTQDPDATAEYYRHSWATIAEVPTVKNIRLRTRKAYREGIELWLKQGYDVIAIYRLETNLNAKLTIRLVEHGKWAFDTAYKLTDEANVCFYESVTAQYNRQSFYDGRNVFTYTDVNPYVQTTTKGVNAGYDLAPDYLIATTTNYATYVGVLYADGTTGTGGAPTGDGGGGSGSGDTYNNTYNYNTNTTYNDLDLDLSPITQRQDAMYASVNQIGRDVNAMLETIDNDLFRLSVLLSALVKGQTSIRSVIVEIRDAIANLHLEGGSVDVDFTELYEELEDFHIDFNSFWEELMQKLETIIRDIENMRRWEPREPLPSPPVGETGIVPWEDVLNITALRDALTRLMGKFPFATINNLITIITALTRPPVAPVFDLPMPNPSDWSSPYMVHVDLSPFDTVAATMRIGITLWAIARVSRRTVSMWTREEGGGDA